MYTQTIFKLKTFFAVIIIFISHMQNAHCNYNYSVQIVHFNCKLQPEISANIKRKFLIQTYILISTVFLRLTTFSRWPEIFKVEPEPQNRLSVRYIILILQTNNFFCLLNCHNDSNNLLVAFIVKFWSQKYRNDIFRYYERRQS